MTPRSTRRAERILIRGANWIGDAVMSTPALQRLRSSFPQAHLTLLTTPLTCELFNDGHALVDEVIPYPRREYGWQTLWRVLPRVRAGRFDLAILFQNAFEAALLAWLAGIPCRVGYGAQGRSVLLTHRLDRGVAHRNRHQMRDYLDLAAAAEALVHGADFQPETESPLPRLAVGPVGLAAGERLLKTGGPVIALNVGATNSRAKCWPARYYAEVANQLSSSVGATIALIGGPGEIDAANAVASLTSAPRLINLAGSTTLPELLGVLSHCALVISNDTGPAHIAAALGRPTLTLFGPTNEFETAPTGPRAALLRADGIECARCMHRDCPIDHRCLTQLTVDSVYNQSLEMLKQ